MTPVHGMGFRHGQHICAFHRTPAEQLSVAADYVADGLRHNERCLYVASSTTLDELRAQLVRLGVDASAAESSGGLLLLTQADGHLSGGHFDSERMLTMLDRALEDALNAGFTALRTCGDMTWLLDAPRGSEQVAEYEALLNPFFSHTRALGMCQYDLQRLPVGLLDHAGLAAHSTVVFDGIHKANPFYSPYAPPPQPFADRIAQLVEEP